MFMGASQAGTLLYALFLLLLGIGSVGAVGVATCLTRNISALPLP